MINVAHVIISEVYENRQIMISNTIVYIHQLSRSYHVERQKGLTTSHINIQLNPFTSKHDDRYVYVCIYVMKQTV